MSGYYDKVKENRARFDGMVERLSRETDAEEVIMLATDAARFASLCGVGLMASSAIERKLRSVAESVGDSSAQGSVAGGTCLVATELYPVGGHTKVLERIAAMLKDEGRLSLVLTASANRFVPDAIRDAVESSGGEVAILEKESGVRKSLQLRGFAEGCDRVLLMVHPEDAVAVAAFGTSRFGKPVFYYNHANHTFWLGASIADCILEINSWGRELDMSRRGIPADRIELVGIPVKGNGASTGDAIAARERLKLDACTPLVVAAGSPRKFRTFGRWNFGELIGLVLSQNDNATFAIVGAEGDSYPEWAHLSARFGDRLLLLPQMPYAELLDLYAAASVVVDSFPMSGWTAMIDAVRQGAATVFPQGVTGAMDCFADSGAYVADAVRAASMVHRLIIDADARRRNVSEMRSRIATALDGAIFSSRLREVLASRNEHRVYQIADTNVEPTELDMFLYAMTVRSKIKFALPGISLSSVREGASKHYELSFLGGRFIWRF